MAFEENYTKIVDGNVHFNIDSFGESDPTNLLEYVNLDCKNRCKQTWDMDNPPDCECPTARLYCAMVKLALMEKELADYKKENVILSREILKAASQLMEWNQKIILAGLSDKVPLRELVSDMRDFVDNTKFFREGKGNEHKKQD